MDFIGFVGDLLEVLFRIHVVRGLHNNTHISRKALDAFGPEMARPPRLERGTLCLEGRCSIQLSYGRTGTAERYFARFHIQGKPVWRRLKDGPGHPRAYPSVP